ncbi:hypothetical protein ALC57_09804, partial [Trachymyrmex cornetzi]
FYLSKCNKDIGPETKQKALALTLYKTIGKCAHICLREVFTDIPCIRTLQLMLQKISLASDLNSDFAAFEEHVSKNIRQRLLKVCILTWDEISIQSNVTYDRKDTICGFEDWGNKRINKPANHVLVLMLRDLNTDCKMLISYNCCDKHIQLVCCIKEHVHVIHEAGFHIHIVATVWDLQISLQ